MEMNNVLLVDGKNCVYRGVYAGLSDPDFINNNKSFAVIIFHFLISYIRKFGTNNICIFWDSTRDSLWRRDLYPGYKEGRKHSIEGVEEKVDNTIQICEKLFPLLGIKNFKREKQEADDLIYAYCKIFTRNNNIIISSDKDFRQVVYQHKNVSLFDPIRNNYMEIVKLDPVDELCFKGEKGDHIEGYHRIGDVTSKVICENRTNFIDFFRTHNKDIYVRNRKLIDLSMCPYVCDNMGYIIEESLKPSSFNKKEFLLGVYNLKIKGIIGDINNILSSFKNK